MTKRPDWIEIMNTEREKVFELLRVYEKFWQREEILTPIEHELHMLAFVAHENVLLNGDRNTALNMKIIEAAYLMGYEAGYNKKANEVKDDSYEYNN